jgi:CheY-like chemotaxis protein
LSFLNLSDSPRVTDKSRVAHTLLLADDSVTIQRVIELTFADEAIKVVAVSDGDQAIERIEANPPDIVLADIGMPGRTGYEVAEHIKQSPRLKHIPVLLLTGAFEPVDQAKAAAAGCDGVLAKPFEPQLVIARVKELLGMGGQAVTSTKPVEKVAPPAPPADDWAPRAAAPKGASPQADHLERLDSYFDQLDAAFQTLGDRTPSAQSGGPAGASPAAELIDWIDGRPAPPGPLPDLPLSEAAPVDDSESGHAPEPEAPPLPPAPEPAPETATAAPAPPLRLPPIADAFAAILAAEQHEPMPATAPAWPTPAAPSTSGGALSEEAVEEITRRIIGRLSDRVVRDTVSDVVSSVAERLVREEIERIKSSIK